MLLPLLFLVPLNVLASPVLPALEARATVSTCNRDNLFRCFTATPVIASSYCSSVIGTTTVTVATTTPTTTVVSSVTSTSTTPTTSPLTTTTTTTTTTSTTKVDTATAVPTITVTTVVTVTATSTATVNIATATVTTAPVKFRRGIEGLVPRAAATPQCLTKDGSQSTSYPASRITSACSCFDIVRSTSRVTATAPQQTVTRTTSFSAIATSTVTSTITNTMTVTITNTISSTTTTTAPITTIATVPTTTTDTTTTSATTTTTVTGPAACVPPPAIPCGTTFTSRTGGRTFRQTYIGCGFSNVNENDSVGGVGPYRAGTTLCDALQICVDDSTSFSSDLAPNGAFSFTLYQRNGLYYCSEFAETGRTAPSDYRQVDTSVQAAYGFSA